MKKLFIFLSMVLPVVFAMAQKSERVETLSTVTVGDDGKPCPGAATVTDIDGNVYNTVIIGKQCWMKENLRTTRYANGESIPAGTSTSTIIPYCYNPEGQKIDGEKIPIKGNQYNWLAVMAGSSSSSRNPSGEQGVCPDGWHVPSDAEWKELTDYVSSQSKYRCDGDKENIAKALASEKKWRIDNESCTVGNNLNANNATGFSVLPEGGYSSHGFENIFNNAYFWSATEDASNSAHGLRFRYYKANVDLGSFNKYYGFSVRCVKD